MEVPVTARLTVVSVLIFMCSGALPVFANGNFSHLWVATDALNYLEEGELKDLLTQDDLGDVLRNGAMFPDGGYAVGDGYGEMAHWEPFQTAYLEWIRATYQPPWSEEAKRHIVFLMGMAAHGMTDQLYDGMYLQRHDYYDVKPSSEPLVGLDGATDGCFAATQGLMTLPEKWVPAAQLAALFSEAGHQVTPQTLEQGQTFVVVALIAANDAVSTPATLAEYQEAYPWACSHQDDPTVPGSPPNSSPTIARYYNVLWARLHGQSAWDMPLLGLHFSGGTPFDQPMASASPESWVSFVMPFGLAPASVNEETVSVTYDGGQTHPVSLKVYYGTNSHLVNIRPQEDWPADTEFVVTLSPPMASWDGGHLAGERAFEFATRPAPMPEPAIEVTPEGVFVLDLEQEAGDLTAGSPEPEEKGKQSGCSAAHERGTPAVPLLLLLVWLLVWRRGFGRQRT
jgi:uncharacterized protein (TIGR03382 family)